RDDWVNAVLGRGEEIWAITDGGLLRSRRTAAGLAPFRRVLARDREAAAAPSWRGALLDSPGRPWFSVPGALPPPDGEVLARPPLPAGAASATVSSLVERPDGDLLVVTADAGLHVFRPAAPAAAAWHRLSVALRPQQTLGDVVRDPAGALWIASRYGLIRWQ